MPTQWDPALDCACNYCLCINYKGRKRKQECCSSSLRKSVYFKFNFKVTNTLILYSWTKDQCQDFSRKLQAQIEGLPHSWKCWHILGAVCGKFLLSWIWGRSQISVPSLKDVLLLLLFIYLLTLPSLIFWFQIQCSKDSWLVGVGIVFLPVRMYHWSPSARNTETEEYCIH